MNSGGGDSGRVRGSKRLEEVKNEGRRQRKVGKSWVGVGKNGWG